MRPSDGTPRPHCDCRKARERANEVRGLKVSLSGGGQTWAEVDEKDGNCTYCGHTVYYKKPYVEHPRTRRRRKKNALQTGLSFASGDSDYL